METSDGSAAKEPKTDLIRDETGSVSSARVLLWVWTVVSLYLVVRHWPTVGNHVLAFLSTVELALIGWAAGPRVAQYLLPQLGAAVTAVAQSKRGDRDPEKGWQPTP
jgi:hypothetical protein